MVLDTLIEALRARLGGILSAIDQLPSFGPLIAAMDAEAVVWARSSVSVHRTPPVAVAAGSIGVGGVSGGGSGGEVNSGSAGKCCVFIIFCCFELYPSDISAPLCFC